MKDLVEKIEKSIKEKNAEAILALITLQNANIVTKEARKQEKIKAIKDFIAKIKK